MASKASAIPSACTRSRAIVSGLLVQIPQAIPVPAVLAGTGIACGICTNKPDTIARDLVHALGIAEAFEAIQGSETGFPKKPDPTGLAYVVAELGAVPETTLMVGDSAADLDTARAAGLKRVVLVSYGYS